MWQVLLAAAAATGSGFLAKKLIKPIDAQNPISGLYQNNQEREQNELIQSQDSVFPSKFNDVVGESGMEETRERNEVDGEIFRFSSAEKGFKGARKKMGSGFRGMEKNKVARKGKKSCAVEGGGKGLVVKQKGKGISVCLKKRRTGKHSEGKCESCASKDNSFGLGVGVGLMYMMSAGKAEISRLNCSMEETARIVHGLKAEIARRKNVHLEYEDATNIMSINTISNGPSLNKPITKSKDSIETFHPHSVAEGEHSSSVPSADQLPEVLEMDQLEAELESELQKLPWCATESSCSEGKTDAIETETWSGVDHEEDGHISKFFQCGGVSATELDNKLCHLLIERQGNEILEYEAELHQAHSKLHDKEAELQALKDCVKRLTEFSLANASDEEAEEREEDERRSYDNREKMELDPRRSSVGMKRMMGFNSYTCSAK